jgi:cytochrome b6-f complex iron-sulfur subunit
MDRKEFLSIVGLGAAVVACGACFEGCTPDTQVTEPPANVDFTLDLTAPENAPLKTLGGYIYNGSIIVARIASGAYVAASSICTHAGGTVNYTLSINRFYCPNHGSTFATDGSVANGPAGSPLKLYNTTLSGNSLRVFS